MWEQLELLNVGRLRIASKGLRRAGDDRRGRRGRPGRDGHVHGRPGRRAAHRRHHRRRAARRGHHRGAGLPRRPARRVAGPAHRAGRRRSTRRPPRWTSPSSAWPACCPARPTWTASGVPCSAASTPSPRSRPSGGTPTTTTPPSRGRGRPAGSASPSGAASSPACPSTRSATASRRPRWAASTRPSCSPWRSPHRALVDAGYAYDAPVRPRPDRGGVRRRGRQRHAGACRPCAPCSRRYLGEVPDRAARSCCPRVTEDSFPGVLANVIAGRVANRLDLGGANYTVDAACASSLAALDVACKELASGHSDLMLCGGADLHNGINDYLMFASVHALSPTGRCRPSTATGRRHRARRGRRVRRTQAAGRRRARRRPDLRGDQGGRRRQRRAGASA